MTSIPKKYDKQYISVIESDSKTVVRVLNHLLVRILNYND